MRHKSLPEDKKNNYSKTLIHERLRFLESQTGHSFEKVGDFTVDPESAKGNIERIIGFAQVPIGVIGPLQVNGQYAQGQYYIPFSTLEGALVMSYQRGARIVSLSGGAQVVLLQDSIQRAPYFVCQDIHQAREFLTWVKGNFPVLQEIAAQTTRHGKLNEYKAFLVGNTVYLRLDYYTGDAMGMNMITKATFAICEYIREHFNIEGYALESNMAVDKKASNINMIMGRGKSVSAEVLVPAAIVKRFLGTTPETIAATYHRQIIGNILAGVMGCNYHFANGLAAMFIACGQDPANLMESANGLINMELRSGDLYVAIYLPSLILATVGGGTGLATQKECLQLMDCCGSNKAKKLAEIMAAALLCGEISLAGAIAAGDFVDAHEKYGRNRPDKKN